jgi:hypothetical protein
MAEEMVFTVAESVAIPATPIEPQKLGLREREHFQEWVVQSPAPLGPDVLIVATGCSRLPVSTGEQVGDVRLNIGALCVEDAT